MVRLNARKKKKHLVELIFSALLIKTYVLMVISFFFFQSPVQAQTWNLIPVRSGLNISQMKPWLRMYCYIMNHDYHVNHFLDTVKKQ